MVEDMNVLKFVAAQLFGKAMQPVDNPDGSSLLEGIEITFKK